MRDYLRWALGPEGGLTMLVIASASYLVAFVAGWV